MKKLHRWLAALVLALGFNLFGSHQAVAASFIATGSLTVARSGHTATLLQNGKVLVTGNAVAQAELYEPATGVWTATGSMITPRLSQATATLLTNGKVLVVGGQNYPQQQHYSLAAAELYDPVTGTWTATGSLATSRYAHTATLLTNGKVLVAGGFSTSFGELTSSELYDPVSGTWTNTPGSLTTGRAAHTATLLPNGKVLVAAGEDNTGHAMASAELFDPATGTWTTLNSLLTARENHTATLLPSGKVLIAGGYNGSYLSSAELFDPGTGNWTTINSMSAQRLAPSATLLPNGSVLVAGGETTGVTFLSSAELYNPTLNSWSATAAMNTNCLGQTATLLPNGRVLLAGGSNNGGAISEAELYDPSVNPATGNWTATGSMNFARDVYTLTLLPNGKALAAGGSGTNASSVVKAELYDPSNTTWTVTGAMNSPRDNHTATLLSTGKVLVAGGYDFDSDTLFSSAELYDPNSQTWAFTGSMSTARIYHTATLLPNGKVLVAGGENTGPAPLASTEVYDPTLGTWTTTGSLNFPRDNATAILLPNGRVLVAGGSGSGGVTASAELYNPATGLWATTGSMTGAREYYTLTLLPNGLVLAVGGQNNNTLTNSAELYNPATGLWSLTGSMNIARVSQRASLLPNGKVLVIGGGFTTQSYQSSELYDPAAGTWTLTGSLVDVRPAFQGVLLPNGRVLVAGGFNGGWLSSAELYDVGQGFSPSWQPQITAINSQLNPGNSLMLTGSQFRGISEGSQGNDQSSPANYPVVQLRSLENGQTLFLPATNWATNSFASIPVTNFPSGYAMATVFVNGIPSQSSLVPAFNQSPATITLGNLSQTYDGTSKPVTLTTSPPGLAVNLTYNGLTSAPTNAGSYTVYAAISDPSYRGSATNTLVIVPALVSVTLGNLLQSYDGSPKYVSVTTVPPGLAYSLTYNGLGFSPFNPGTYTVIGTITDPNYQGGATNTLNIVQGLTLDTSHTVRTVDPRWYGVNTAIWDSHFDTDSTSNALREIGCRTLRFPGGSISDDYHWETGIRDDGYPYDPTKFSNFMHVATNANVNAYITVNYGSGTTNEAADWVRCANVTNLCGFKYWEVGNECYGSWERDLNTNPPYSPHDPWTYAMRFKDYYTAMKAADPTIKVGIMVSPGEDSYGTGLNYVQNPRTGIYHSGWTPVVLATLQSLGVTPDFAAHHVYPEYQADDDATLLQASSNWAGDAANLRQQISDYCGSSGSNIELVCTENNADAGSQGRQSTSLVNALYLADSLSQISKTEFNSFVWWDLRNGPDTGGDFDPSLYGWRTNGDLGIMYSTDTRYPTYYAMKLMQYFAQPGDTILNAATSDSLLSFYAAQSADGAVNLLVVNKDPSNTLTRPIVLAGYAPNSLATIRSFGIPQDEATRTNSTIPGAQDIATNSISTASGSFNYSFPPYSLTVFSLSPAPPALIVLPPSGLSSNMFVFQLSGQPGVAYVLQTSTDLSHWTPTVTNKMTASVVNVTNPISPAIPEKFWRAIWQP